ncbi:MAG: hypothetical protein CXX80_01065 [Methanobacteriota archaeon]|nr:MAG: hypothetical protein CXX80_03920 [Euryarchaeota archaeon]PXY77286.1 MAG: hypothetical protein CXX80_01065 [Euryarchaeota archaeon]
MTFCHSVAAGATLPAAKQQTGRVEFEVFEQGFVKISVFRITCSLGVRHSSSQKISEFIHLAYGIDIIQQSTSYTESLHSTSCQSMVVHSLSR